MGEPLAAPARSGVRSPRVLGALVALVVVAIAAYGGIQAKDWRDADQRWDQRANVVDVATDVVLALTNVSSESTEKDLEEFLAHTTESFREDFEGQSDAFFGALRKGHVTSTGEVVSAGVAELDSDEATVLLAASGSVQNKRAAEAEPRNYRLRVELSRVDGDWLVSGMEFVA